MATVLIIDDDEILCRVLQEAFAEEEDELLCAHTLEEGLKIASSGDIDVVFLDVRLPDGDGLSALSKIRAFPSQPEVIILTGSGTPDGAELAIESGAWDYVQKPSSISVMKLHLMRAIQYRNEKKGERPIEELRMDGVLGSSPRMKDCYALISEAASTDVNVLITGETGTGKELFAKAIHSNSRRSKKSFVVVDCAALQETLIESILFGYEKGAFTGAVQTHEGLFRQADGGTLFLDEIGELPFSTQKVFLRALQEHRYRPLGCRKEVESNFRLIAATNRDLDGMVDAGKFREDLLYRLRAHVITVPPLRERREDIEEIAGYHIDKICKRNGLHAKVLSPDFIDALLFYPWPGNVRELVNALERAVAVGSSASTLFRKHLPDEIRVQLAQSSMNVDAPATFGTVSDAPPSGKFPSLKDVRESTYSQVERKYLQDLIKYAEGDIARAAELSDLSERRLYELLKKHRISAKG